MSWSFGTVYTKPWFWRKGNRVSTESDTITIRIGGIDEYGNEIDHSAATKAPNQQHFKQTTKAATKRRYKSSRWQWTSRNSSSIANNRISTTNYSLLTFLPKNLWEQFKRIANFYFLVMAVVASVIDSPVSPWTSLVPLLFVVSVTAIKQGYEDLLRFRADILVNRSFATVIRNGVEIDIKCEDILQGDLVKASRDCDVPCDLVLLKTSDAEGKCFITTANLDGETNLKTLFVPKGFPLDVPIERLHDIGTIECEPPIPDLYTFNGRLEVGSLYYWSQNRQSTLSDTLRRHKRTLPLISEHLLLRGSRIKNTEWAIGCAVAVGQNTKLALNGRVFCSKTSSSEKFINRFLIFFVVCMVALVTFCFIMERYLESHEAGHDIYLGTVHAAAAIPQFVQDYFSFVILFNYLIPISLYVTIELHKFVGSLFLEWDVDLYDLEQNQQCLVNTSNLNEELGQIKILFSDKTGTLTKNEMILKQCSIAGTKYKFANIGVQQDDQPNVLQVPQYSSEMLSFFQTLSVCHTVQVGDGSADDTADIEKSFEIVESKQSLSDSDEDVMRKVETRNNTKRNEVSVPDNVLRNLPLDIGVAQLRQHRRVESLSSAAARKITFHKDDRVPLRNSGNYDYAPKIPSPLTLDQTNPMDRVRFEYKRSMSTKDQQSRARMGHRRTQSYTTAETMDKNRIDQTNRNDLRKTFQNRSSANIANTREYFAAPAYNEASLLERKESMRQSLRLNRSSVAEQVIHFDYQASSPDEKALVEGIGKVGFIFAGETNSILSIKIQSQRTPSIKPLPEMHFERLETLEFTSNRKRMSVIVRDATQQIWMYTKGAESHVFPLCRKTLAQTNLIRATRKHIDDFANIGLRTLAVARRKLTVDEYQQFSAELSSANSSLANRKNMVEAVQAKIEIDLELLGATAVEDALQDNVRDTLVAIRRAGITVWILTGDKIETAYNISKSCGHIGDNAKLYFITECKEEHQIQQHLDTMAEEIPECSTQQVALLIDGTSLTLIMKYSPERFRDLAIKCQSVLCCRLSPLQKCEVVKLMKTLPDVPITAAIGDGANDVSMIREAHVGLGIVGKEGRQAALCADYSFTNFCMLKKLLLVHGHFFSYRFSLLVLYFFYKNLVFMLIQVFFQINNFFSTETIYDPLFLTCYNVIYTSWPILILSLTEKPYDQANLMSAPELYKENAGNKRITWKYFIAWIALSFYHSTVVYATGFMIWNRTDTIHSKPWTADLSSFGAFLMHNVVLVVTLKLWMLARYQTLAFIFTMVASVLFFVVSTVVYNFFTIIDGRMLGAYNHLLTSLSFWMANVLICVAALLPDYVIIALKMFNIKVRPTDTIAGGWNRLMRETKNPFQRKSDGVRQSTYL